MIGVFSTSHNSGYRYFMAFVATAVFWAGHMVANHP